jgi:hypothetical protein
VISWFGCNESTEMMLCFESIEDVTKVAESILSSLLALFVLSSCEITISTNVGGGGYPVNGKDVSTLLCCFLKKAV